MARINGLFILRSAAEWQVSQFDERIGGQAFFKSWWRRIEADLARSRDIGVVEMAEVLRLTPDNGGELARPGLHSRKTSGDADVAPESVGQELCNARQRSGKMLMDVWRELKINPDYLLAIEESRFKALPGRVYAIGFVRAYAAYLGLDAEVLVDRLKAEMAGPDASEPVVGLLPPPESNLAPDGPLAPLERNLAQVGPFSPPERELPQGSLSAPPERNFFPQGSLLAPSERELAQNSLSASPERKSAQYGPLAPPERRSPQRSLLAWPEHNSAPDDLLASSERKFSQGGVVIAGLMAAVLLYYGYNVFSSAQRMGPPPVIPVPARLAAEAGLTQKPGAAPPLAIVKEPVPSLRREPALAPSIEVAPTQPVSVPLATVEQPTPKLPVSAPLATVEQPTPKSPAEPAPPASPETAPIQPVSVPAEPAPRLQVPPPERGRYDTRSSRITLRVHRSTHVAVQGTGKRVFIDRVLAAGATYRVPNMAGLRLIARDAGAVEVILDGISVGFAGKNGVTASGLSLTPQNVINLRQPG